MIPVAQPVLGEEEIEAVTAVLRSGHLVQGEQVERFERRIAEMLGVKHAVAVSSGTAALHVALLAHDIGPGDEVITTPFTFVATANAVLYTGARPVFVDVSPDTLNIDPALIESQITTRTKAILPVHLYGHPADMGVIELLAAWHRLAVIEDASQALGAAIGSRPVGTFGTACFSLYATKNITTAEGGIVVTDDDRIDDRLRLLRSHGQRERYHHEILGYNYRLTDLQAAIGLVQLDRLPWLTTRRIENAGYLNARLQNVATPQTRPGSRHVYHQYTVRIPRRRDAAKRILEEAGIGCSVHYPLPVHQQPLYLTRNYGESFPIAEQACREVLSLPVHPSLTKADLDVIARAVTSLPVGATAACAV